MSLSHISAELRHLVRQRAAERCEYCRIPESATFSVHEMDHIIAEKHGGPTNEENLSLACALCNGFKGSDLASIDPVTSQPAELFHPRHHRWPDHFHISGARIEGLTATGRATARLLRFNDPERVEERKYLQLAGLLPQE